VRSFFASETGAALQDWPATGSGAQGGLDCVGKLCRYTARGHQVAIVTAAAALPTKCGGIDAIVAQVPAGFRCRSIVRSSIASTRARAAAGCPVARPDGNYHRERKREPRRPPLVPHPRQEGSRCPRQRQACHEAERSGRAGSVLGAQWVGEALPLTHYLRIVRSIMLKGSTLADLQFDTLALGGLMPDRHDDRSDALLLHA